MLAISGLKRLSSRGGRHQKGSPQCKQLIPKPCADDAGANHSIVTIAEAGGAPTSAALLVLSGSRRRRPLRSKQHHRRTDTTRALQTKRHSQGLVQLVVDLSLDTA